MKGSGKYWKVGSEDSFLQTTQHLWLSKKLLNHGLLCCSVSYRLEKPSQDNAEYINSGIASWPSLITSGATLLGITMNSRLGTKCGAPHFAPLLLRPLLEFSPHIPSTHVIAVAGPPKNRDFISTLISILWFTD